MIIDTHAYWDDARMSLDVLQQQMHQHGLTRVILSPPCTQVYEPDKSATMYAIQRILLKSNVLWPLAEFISRSFYDKNDRLRPFWRLFTRHNRPINKVIIPDNTDLLEAIAPFDNLYAWYWLNPVSLPDKSQIQEEIRHPRVIGLKLHAYWHQFTVKDAREAFVTAEKAGLPVYLILGFGWVDSVIELLREFPSTSVILGYGGFPYFGKLWKRIQSFENATVDFASLHIDQQGIGAAIKALGPTRCMYGSDCPYNFKDAQNRFDYSKTIQRITQLKIGTDAHQLILGGNAEKLLFQ